MELVDTHCHIHGADFPLPLPDVEARARAAGVTRYICVGTDADDSALAVEFAATRSGVWASVGLHPHEATHGPEQLPKLQALIGQKDHKIVAVGECGLDYFYGHSSKVDQEKALRFQIELAIAQQVPLIFHVREAFVDFWPIFDDYPNLRGVIHSFTDTKTQLDELLARGLFVGVNGIMTFTKNDWQLEVAKSIPQDKLLLETDAPFLTPAPHRGRVNEPARVSVVAEFLAKLRNETVASVAAASTRNARHLFSF